MVSTTINKEKAKTHLEAINTVTLKHKGREVTAKGKEFEEAAKRKLSDMERLTFARTQAEIADKVMPEQMTFEFADIFSDIALKEAIKHIKTITKAAANLGASDFTVKSMMQSLALESRIIYAAVNAIKESLAA